MRRIKILKGGLSEEELAAMKALAAQAGFAIDEIEVIEAVGEPDDQCDDEIVLISATPAICASPDLEDALIATQRGSRRAVCVWPKDGEGVEPPPAATKYAYSIIRPHADTLRAVVADDDVLCFEKADGQPLPKPETERNLCVDEKKVATA